MFVSSNQHQLSVKICSQPQPIPSSLQDDSVPIHGRWSTRPRRNSRSP